MREPNTLPLDPPATAAELDHAAEIWTAAQDNMVARGYARHLWGCQPAAGHEFVVLMLRAEQACPCHPGAPLLSSPNTELGRAERRP
jgi:hypothetical protein